MPLNLQFSLKYTKIVTSFQVVSTINYAFLPTPCHLGTQLHHATTRTSPPLAFHIRPTPMAHPPLGLLRLLRARRVQRHQGSYGFLGVGVADGGGYGAR